MCDNIAPPNSPQIGHAVDVVILHLTREFSLIPMGSLLQNASIASLTLGSSRLCHNIAPPNSPQTGHAVDVVILHFTREFSVTSMGSLLQNASFASPTLESLSNAASLVMRTRPCRATPCADLGGADVAT